VTPELHVVYQAERASARESLFVLLRSVRELLGHVDYPSPARRRPVEIRTVHDLVSLALDRRVPIETVDELLRKLEERDDDAEPIAIFGGDEDPA
jgi:hypothetical protein